MDILHIALIAIIQGLTEFLPVSSSAHLVLIPLLTHSPDQGLSFDVAVHVGSLVAVLLYFHRDFRDVISAWFKQGFKKERSFDANLGWYLLIGTIPAGIAGLLFHDWIDLNLRSAEVVAYTSIGYGLLLGAADYWGRKTDDFQSVRLKHAILIGCAQALALVPGTSRSGITMTMGLLLGLKRKAAARFSFMLSVPVILMAGMMEGGKLLFSAQAVDWHPFLYGAAISAIVALMAIHFMMRLIEKIGMLPFVIYRVILGVILLIWLA